MDTGMASQIIAPKPLTFQTLSPGWYTKAITGKRKRPPSKICQPLIVSRVRPFHAVREKYNTLSEYATIETSNKTRPIGVALLLRSSGHAARTTPLIHSNKQKIVTGPNRCRKKRAEIRLINTGLVATASEPSPAETCRMAITYRPR